MKEDNGFCASGIDLNERMDDYSRAAANREDRWVPASGGMDLPFIRHDNRWQRVFNPAQGRHGYMLLKTGAIYQDFPR
jgi:hypothetical protein